MPLFKGGKAPPTAQSMNVFGRDNPDEPVYPCKVCGRKFIKDSLRKHEPACKKLTKKPRKTFESGKQRIGAGSDLRLSDIERVKREIQKNGGKFERPKTNWKERHEDFITSVSAAKGVDVALKTGKPLPPPPPSKTPSDYVKCPHCGRSFNSNAAERHMPFCKDKAEKDKMVSDVRAKQPLRSRGSMNGGPNSAPIRRTLSSDRSISTSAGQQRRQPTSGGDRAGVATRNGRSNSVDRGRTGSKTRDGTRTRDGSRDRAKTRDGPKTRDGSKGRENLQTRGSVKTREGSRTRDGSKSRGGPPPQSRNGNKPPPSRRQEGTSMSRR